MHYNFVPPCLISENGTFFEMRWISGLSDYCGLQIWGDGEIDCTFVGGFGILFLFPFNFAVGRVLASF
jgi:hypothetical protein